MEYKNIIVSHCNFTHKIKLSFSNGKYTLKNTHIHRYIVLEVNLYIPLARCFQAVSYSIQIFFTT
jgi:hypothetical protein